MNKTKLYNTSYARFVRIAAAKWDDLENFSEPLDNEGREGDLIEAHTLAAAHVHAVDVAYLARIASYGLPMFFNTTIDSALWPVSSQRPVVATSMGDTPGPCGRCGGTGQFITRVVNGKPEGPGGICFRCGGKGVVTIADSRRNWGYDNFYMRVGN